MLAPKNGREDLNTPQGGSKDRPCRKSRTKPIEAATPVECLISYGMTGSIGELKLMTERPRGMIPVEGGHCDYLFPLPNGSTRPSTGWFVPTERRPISYAASIGPEAREWAEAIWKFATDSDHGVEPACRAALLGADEATPLRGVRQDAASLQGGDNRT
jgi:hypothetical protein